MSFSKQLKEFAINVGEATERIRKGVCMELFSSVIMDTPVDTGRARGNHQTSVGAPKTNRIDRLDPTGSLAIAEAQANLGGPGDTVYLTNNLPYIERLEFDGWSKQAPNGMFRKNVARVQPIIDEHIRKNKV